MIALIDYNLGNLKSVVNAFEVLGEKVEILKDPNLLKNYHKAVLPGVGAFGDAMKNLKKSGMDEAIKEFANDKKPLLGICLGMQILFEKSEEFGSSNGLGLLKGEVVFFDKKRFVKPLKVPHMGWNTLHVKKESRLLKGVQDKTYLYFVHSLHVKAQKEDVASVTNYGYEFASVVEKDNIFGVQPHPEKSHENGLKILKNFIGL